MKVNSEVTCLKFFTIISLSLKFMPFLKDFKSEYYLEESTSILNILAQSWPMGTMNPGRCNMSMLIQHK